jgi:hypothetical protein
MDRSTTTQQGADEVWSAQAEAELFDGLERYPPVGACKYFNVASLAALLRRNAHLHVSPAALWRRLGSLYNLPRLVLPLPPNRPVPPATLTPVALVRRRKRRRARSSGRSSSSSHRRLTRRATTGKRRRKRWWLEKEKTTTTERW